MKYIKDEEFVLCVLCETEPAFWAGDATISYDKLKVSMENKRPIVASDTLEDTRIGISDMVHGLKEYEYKGGMVSSRYARCAYANRWEKRPGEPPHVMLDDRGHPAVLHFSISLDLPHAAWFAQKVQGPPVDELPPVEDVFDVLNYKMRGLFGTSRLGTTDTSVLMSAPAHRNNTVFQPQFLAFSQFMVRSNAGRMCTYHTYAHLAAPVHAASTDDHAIEAVHSKWWSLFSSHNWIWAPLALPLTSERARLSGQVRLLSAM